jgi:Flp pilus assembly pilin Flp
MPSSRRIHFMHDDELGQTLSEYAILVGGIAVIVAVTLPLVGNSIAGFFTAFAQAFGG